MSVRVSGVDWARGSVRNKVVHTWLCVCLGVGGRGRVEEGRGVRAVGCGRAPVVHSGPACPLRKGFARMTWYCPGACVWDCVEAGGKDKRQAGARACNK